MSRPNLRTAAAGATLAALLAAPDFARAQGKFEASYGISVTRICSATTGQGALSR